MDYRSTLQFNGAIFDSNAGASAASLFTSGTITGTTGQIVNATFRGHSAGTTTIEYVGITWSCALGRYMPRTGAVTGNFDGCAHRCASGFYGTGETNECSGRCWEGHYCDEGAVVPIPCPSGTHLPLRATGTSSFSCIPYTAPRPATSLAHAADITLRLCVGASPARTTRTPRLPQTTATSVPWARTPPP